MPGWLHTVLTVTAGVASVAAQAFIPATALIPGIHLPIVYAVQLALVAGAAVGIDGSKVANTIAGVLTPKAKQ